MKKVVIIAICIIGMASLSSCRSTSKSCGLAENINLEQQQSSTINFTEKV